MGRILSPAVLVAVVFILLALVLILLSPSLKVHTYTDPQYGFQVTLPDGYYDAGTLDGVYAYNKFFANRDVHGNYAYETQPGDISISFMISKKDSPITNAESLKEVQGTAKISGLKNITIGGQPAIEEFEDDTAVTDGDFGCQLATYFMRGVTSYQIAMFSTDCNLIRNATESYNRMVASFR
jgi:hypothetical protein